MPSPPQWLTVFALIRLSSATAFADAWITAMPRRVAPETTLLTTMLPLVGK